MFDALQSTLASDARAEPYVDLGNPATFEYSFPHEWFAWARAKSPISRHYSTHLNQEFWAISSCALFDQVMTDAGSFSSQVDTVAFNNLPPGDLYNARQLLINMDPPRQTAFRRIISRAFTPDAVAVMGDKIDAIARNLVEGLDTRNEVDIVSKLATEMPLRVMCELLGADPEDRNALGSNLEIITFGDDPDLRPEGANDRVAASRLFHYGMELCRKQKDNQNSIVGMLANGKVGDEYLTTEEFCFFFLFVFLAGFHTTKSMLSSMLEMLAQEPEQFAAVRARPDIVPNAVEEVLRLEPANIHFCRTATRDISIGNEHIQEGDKIALFFHSVNRDPSLNTRPDVFDVTRDRVQHRSFGRGIHSCLGAFLARREMQAILRELSERHTGMTLCERPVRARSNAMRYFKEMKIAFS